MRTSCDSMACVVVFVCACQADNLQVDSDRVAGAKCAGLCLEKSWDTEEYGRQRSQQDKSNFAHETQSNEDRKGSGIYAAASIPDKPRTVFRSGPLHFKRVGLVHRPCVRIPHVDDA